jgi:hypothetical protein
MLSIVRLDFQASEDDVKAALEELDTIGKVNVVFTDKRKATRMLAASCPALNSLVYAGANSNRMKDAVMH